MQGRGAKRREERAQDIQERPVLEAGKNSAGVLFLRDCRQLTRQRDRGDARAAAGGNTFQYGDRGLRLNTAEVAYSVP